jgi:hypothetical protein
MENEKEIIYDVKEKKGLSQDELNILLKKWQEKLEMKDWNLDLKIVEFRRKNGYRQSGDFIADPSQKTATILMTNDPWRGDEEYTLVHELLHVLVYDYDKYSENLILKTCNEDSPEHEEYMNKLEETVHHLTRIILGRSDR